jgi:hypothetical protein
MADLSVLFYCIYYYNILFPRMHTIYELPNETSVLARNSRTAGTSG